MKQAYEIEILEQSEDTIRFKIQHNNQCLSFQQVFKRWSEDENFIKFYVKELIEINHQAFYWEHPALTKAYLTKDYECIIQKSRPLETLSANERAFSDYIFKDTSVEDFMNIGKDARLVIPTKQSTKDIYNHLGKFIRHAEETQILNVFKRLGKIIEKEIENRAPIWLNTAGLGVIWLHIRMDTRPKYYKTDKYKEPMFLDLVN